MLMQFTVAEGKRNEDNSQVDCTTHILSVTAVAFKVYYILFVVGNDQTNILSVQALVIYFSLKKTIVFAH